MTGFKRVFFAAMSLVLGATFLFVARQAEAASKEKKLPSQIIIGWTPPDVTGVFATATDYFNKAAAQAREHGINVKIVTQSLAEHTQFSEQVNIIEDFIARHVDAIAISPSEVEPIIPAIQQANAQHIPVIIVNLLEPIKGTDVTSYVGFDNAEAAEVSGYAMLNYLGGPGPLVSKWGKPPTVVNPKGHLDLAFWKKVYKNVDPATADIHGKIAIINGIAGGFFANERQKGFMEVIKPFEGVQVLETLYADWNRQKAVNAAQDIMQAHPDVDAIWGSSNEMAMGAELAVEAVHKHPQIGVLSNDGTPESVQMIRDHRLVAETWHGFPEWGWYGTEYGVMAALGLRVPKIFNIDPRTEYVGNADDFYPNPKLEPIPWDKIIQEYLSKSE